MTSAQNEINSNVDEMATRFGDKYEAMDKEISQIGSSVGSAKNGLTSQIRRINVSFIFDIFYFPFDMYLFILGKTR